MMRLGVTGTGNDGSFLGPPYFSSTSSFSPTLSKISSLLLLFSSPRASTAHTHSPKRCALHLSFVFCCCYLFLFFSSSLFPPHSQRSSYSIHFIHHHGLPFPFEKKSCALLMKLPIIKKSLLPFWSFFFFFWLFDNNEEWAVISRRGYAGTILPDSRLPTPRGPSIFPSSSTMSGRFFSLLVLSTAAVGNFSFILITFFVFLSLLLLRSSFSPAHKFHIIISSDIDAEFQPDTRNHHRRAIWMHYASITLRRIIFRLILPSSPGVKKSKMKRSKQFQGNDRNWLDTCWHPKKGKKNLETI